MEFGQMSIKTCSTKADYLQLDICGHTPEQALQRFLAYQTTIPLVLHGDWEKKGCSENNIEARVPDYINIIRLLQAHTHVKGFTMHPPFRKKVPFETFLSCCQQITEETGVNVWIENRSNQRIWLSIPEEITAFSQSHVMTIDLVQLYISCGYDHDRFLSTIQNIHWNHVQEIHVSNVKRTEKNTFVARKLEDGELCLPKLLPWIKPVPHWTFEILGGVPTFESQVAQLQAWLKTER